MLSRFCQLSKPPPPLAPFPLFLTDNIKMNGIPSKIDWKIHPLFISIFYNFLLFCVSFYISRHNFSQIIRTSSIIIWQKNFVTNFPFLTDSLKPSHPLNSQNSLSVIKVFCRCSLTAFFFFRTRASTVIPTKWCKTFEACTWTISEFDINLLTCYNIAIRRRIVFYRLQFLWVWLLKKQNLLVQSN